MTEVRARIRGTLDSFRGLTRSREAVVAAPRSLLGEFAYRRLETRRLGEARAAATLPRPLNAALRSEDEVRDAVAALDRLRLRARYDHPLKVWDGYRFFAFLAQRLEVDAKILDLGSGFLSNVLDWLALYGYRDLWATDVLFAAPRIKGGVHYLGEDMRRTHFEEATFDAVMAQSALEHGNAPADFLREADRLCRSGGYLLVSTDFWPEKVDTRDVRMYGVPWTIFSSEELQDLLDQARGLGFTPVEPVDLRVGAPLVTSLGRRYTFVFVALQKA